MIHHSARLRRRTLLGAGAALPLALTACSGPEPTGPQGPPDKVTYLTNFGVFGRDAYAWLAAVRGHFARANLEVDIQPGAGTIANAAGLLSGRAQFAAIDMAAAGAVYGSPYRGSDADVAEQLGGRPIEEIVALAAIHQQPLGTIMAYEGSGIAEVRDLPGRTIALPPGASTSLLWPAYIGLALGSDALDDINIITVEAAGLVPALVAGEADGIGQFVPGRALVEAAGGGRQVVMLPYAEYLSDIYGTALFTTVDLVENDPQLCVRMRDAIIAGLADGMEDPAAAGDALAAAVPEADPAVAAAEMDLMSPYCRTGGTLPLGHIDKARLARHIAMLASVGLLDARPDLTPADLAAFELVPGGER